MSYHIIIVTLLQRFSFLFRKLIFLQSPAQMLSNMMSPICSKNFFLIFLILNSKMMSNIFYIFYSIFSSSGLKKVLSNFYQGYVRVIWDLLTPYPKLHPYNGGFNLASGLLFMSCNTQLDKPTFSDTQKTCINVNGNLNI